MDDCSSGFKSGLKYICSPLHLYGWCMSHGSLGPVLWHKSFQLEMVSHPYMDSQHIHLYSLCRTIIYKFTTQLSIYSLLDLPSVYLTWCICVSTSHFFRVPQCFISFDEFIPKCGCKICEKQNICLLFCSVNRWMYVEMNFTAVLTRIWRRHTIHIEQGVLQWLHLKLWKIFIATSLWCKLP